MRAKRIQSRFRMYEQFAELDNVFITEGNVTDYDSFADL